MAKLKVFGGIRFISRKQRRAFVAATSQKAAAEFLGVSLSNFRDYFMETNNPAVVPMAMERPGVVFFTEINVLNPKPEEISVWEDAPKKTAA